MATTDVPEFNLSLEFFRNLNIFHDLLSSEISRILCIEYKKIQLWKSPILIITLPIIDDLTLNSDKIKGF